MASNDRTRATEAEATRARAQARADEQTEADRQRANERPTYPRTDRPNPDELARPIYPQPEGVRTAPLLPVPTPIQRARAFELVFMKHHGHELAAAIAEIIKADAANPERADASNEEFERTNRNATDFRADEFGRSDRGDVERVTI